MDTAYFSIGSRAHPRGCGADTMTGPVHLDLEGSSPRVRGRHHRLRYRHPRLRLIPAGAGQTGAGGGLLFVARAHPRGCGADLCLRRLHLCACGSSPRVRGRRTRLSTHSKMCVAHPRGCGADVKRYRRLRLRSGSSPRVRGRRDLVQRLVDRLRLIPAGAGQTSPGRDHQTRSSAHPRGCGADGPGCRFIVTAPGSSPRVRGRRAGTVFPAERVGLIPAGAGQTSAATTAAMAVAAHPRGCGADGLRTRRMVSRSGSSPRVRGRPPAAAPAHRDAGLIPAGAGQTSISTWPSRTGWAHPRGCGADRPQEGGE